MGTRYYRPSLIDAPKTTRGKLMAFLEEWNNRRLSPRGRAIYESASEILTEAVTSWQEGVADLGPAIRVHTPEWLKRIRQLERDNIY